MSGSVDANVDEKTETLLAIRNAFKLGGSLLFTWGIALSMRLLLPRFLGPARYGTLNFADAFTTTFFITLGLGCDSYIHKEVAVRHSHASDFIGGTFVLRTIMTLGIFAAMGAVMSLSHRPAEVQHVVFVYGAAQFFVTANASLSALLHARGRVGGMSVLSVATKIIWALGVLAAMRVGAGLWAYAASYFASEFVETFALYALARAHCDLAFRVDWVATRAMVLASLPYYLNAFATTAYGKLDVSLLTFAANSEEVGFYSASGAVAGLTLLVVPLIGWVLLPMFSRAANRSRDELFGQVRRSIDLILTVAIPASLLINVGADVWIRFVFGAAFAPAAPALRVLSTMFVVTYLAIVQAMVLVMLERAWALVRISFAGLIVNVVLNFVLIHFSLRTLGRGGGGTGCAVAMLGTEIFVTSCMMVAIGRGTFDRKGLAVLAKSLGAYAFVVLADRWLRPMGPVRLLVDAAMYLAIVLSTGALRLKELVASVRAARGPA